MTGRGFALLGIEVFSASHRPCADRHPPALLRPACPRSTAASGPSADSRTADRSSRSWTEETSEHATAGPIIRTPAQAPSDDWSHFPGSTGRFGPSAGGL